MRRLVQSEKYLLVSLFLGGLVALAIIVVSHLL